MTREEILNMEAGREMDALVAEKVIGIPKPNYVHPANIHQEHGSRVVIKGWYCQPNYAHGDVCEWYPQPYSTDIASAWEVVEKLQAEPLEYFFSIQMTPAIPYNDKPCWHVELGGLRGHAPTAPLAICRSALLATIGE